MLQGVKPQVLEGKMLLSALAYWAAAALLLLCAAAGILARLSVGEVVMGYVSSGLSFFSALCAGLPVGRYRQGGLIYPALLTAAVLTTALLTLGFIVEGQAISASGVLSVVSFTFTGCLAGAVLSGGKKQKRYKARYRK